MQLLALATFLINQRKLRRYWIHPVNTKRETKGEFYCLVKELESVQTFHQYFRMSKAQFEKIHSLIEEDIKKIRTKFRKPTETKERLGECTLFRSVVSCRCSALRPSAILTRTGIASDAT